MVIAAAYIRVSTDDQTEYSPESQRKRLLDYARGHDMQIPEDYIFLDEGISGRNARKRPAFQRMIALAKTKHAFQVILVWKFSRFARNRQDSIFYKSMLRKDCGIDVISITEPLSQDPTSILMEALLEAMDEYYSINLAQEVKRGLQERFSRGKPICSPPFGYRLCADAFEPHPEQAAWVQYMYQAYADGQSLTHIAEYLEDHRIRTNRDNPFRSRSINYILLNPVYKGTLRKCTAPASIYDRYYQSSSMSYVDHAHPPLVSPALWQQVQLRWQAEHATPSARQSLSPCPAGKASVPGQQQPAGNPYFLKGVLYCKCCGSALIQIKKGYAFQCSGYNHGHCKQSQYIRRTELEAHIYRSAAPYLSETALTRLQDTSLSAAERNQILLVHGLSFRYTDHQVVPMVNPVPPCDICRSDIP